MKLQILYNKYIQIIKGKTCMFEELFWPVIIILGSIYLIFIEVKNYKYKRNIMLKIKYIEEDIINMKIVNKSYSKGNLFQYKMPDTYIVELEYEDYKYEINDEEIFNSFEIGQYVELKLVKNLDENRNLITYDIFR